jgi:hypothetical protein
MLCTAGSVRGAADTGKALDSRAAAKNATIFFI